MNEYRLRVVPLDQTRVRLPGTPHAVPRLIEVSYLTSDDGPDYIGHVEVDNGVGRVTRLSMVAQEDGRPVRNRDIKTLPSTDELIRDALEFSTLTVVSESEHATEYRLDPLARLPHSVRQTGGKSRQFLSEVAKLHHEGGDTPVRHVAEQLNVSRRTARRYVSAATAAGLISR